MERKGLIAPWTGAKLHSTSPDSPSIASSSRSPRRQKIRPPTMRKSCKGSRSLLGLRPDANGPCERVGHRPVRSCGAVGEAPMNLPLGQVQRDHAIARGRDHAIGEVAHPDRAGAQVARPGRLPRGRVDGPKLGPLRQEDPARPVRRRDSPASSGWTVAFKCCSQTRASGIGSDRLRSLRIRGGNPQLFEALGRGLAHGLPPASSGRCDPAYSARAQVNASRAEILRSAAWYDRPSAEPAPRKCHVVGRHAQEMAIDPGCCREIPGRFVQGRRARAGPRGRLATRDSLRRAPQAGGRPSRPSPLRAWPTALRS